MALLFPFLIAVIMLVLAIGKRCFVVPIGKLLEVSQNLKHGNLDARVSGSVESGELRRLGLAFDDMAQQLAGREQELRKSESEYRFLTENSADIVWRMDSNRCITYINPADERLRGYSKEEVLGRRLIDLMPQEDAERLTKINSERHALEQAGIVTGLTSFETSMYCKNGEVICVEVLSSPIRDENGTIVGSHGVARDISKRRKYEKEREMLIEQLQSALAEIKTLSGMLPICCSCKKIRDDKGYWNQLETYISDHSDAMFSHGYCPECAEKFYQEIDTFTANRNK
jgi:PAS domain S-box-containing protein